MAGLFSLWAAGGERCDDLAQLREEAGLALLLGHGLPAPQTARDCLDAFDQEIPPLWQGERCQVQGEGERLQGLAKANRRLIGFLQERAPQTTAEIDLDATILESHKRAARPPGLSAPVSLTAARRGDGPRALTPVMRA